MKDKLIKLVTYIEMTNTVCHLYSKPTSDEKFIININGTSNIVINLNKKVPKILLMIDSGQKP